MTSRPPLPTNLRVELDRGDGQRRVLDRHHDAIVRERGRAQAAVGRQVAAVERVVARDLDEGVRPTAAPSLLVLRLFLFLREGASR